MSLAELHKKQPPQSGDLVIVNRQMRMVKIIDGDPEYLDRSVSCGGGGDVWAGMGRCGFSETAVVATWSVGGTHLLTQVGYSLVTNDISANNRGLVVLSHKRVRPTGLMTRPLGRACGVGAELRSARSRCSRCDNVTAAVSDTSFSFDGALKTAVGPTSATYSEWKLNEVEPPE